MTEEQLLSRIEELPWHRAIFSGLDTWPFRDAPPKLKRVRRHVLAVERQRACYATDIGFHSVNQYFILFGNGIVASPGPMVGWPVVILGKAALALAARWRARERAWLHEQMILAAKGMAEHWA